MNVAVLRNVDDVARLARDDPAVDLNLQIAFQHQIILATPSCWNLSHCTVEVLIPMMPLGSTVFSNPQSSSLLSGLTDCSITFVIISRIISSLIFICRSFHQRPSDHSVAVALTFSRSFGDRMFATMRAVMPAVSLPMITGVTIV